MLPFWLLGSNDRSVIVWNVGGNLNLESELVKPCSALSHYGNNNTEVSDGKFCLYWLQWLCGTVQGFVTGSCQYICHRGNYATGNCVRFE